MSTRCTSAAVAAHAFQPQGPLPNEAAMAGVRRAPSRCVLAALLSASLVLTSGFVNTGYAEPAGSDDPSAPWAGAVHSSEPAPGSNMQDGFNPEDNAASFEPRPLETAAPVSPADPNDYRLGPRDKVRIQVFEWRPARDEIFAWEALNSEYSVGVSGRLALPLIGQVPAEGKTTQELAGTISELLQRRMGTVTAPDATVEIVEHRPFYITGDVNAPGEYLYRPGLTVLQAVSLGGGMRRANGLEGAAFVRQMLESEGNLSLLDQERISLLAKHARLIAEIEGHKQVEPPKSFENMATDPTAMAALRNERLIFDTRLRTFKKQLQTLDELKAHLEGETSSLTKQIKTADRRIALLNKELNGIRRLSRKGLVTAPRLLGLERTLAQLQGERLQLEARQSKVRSEIAQTEIAKLDLMKRRSEDATVSLQETMAQLDQIDRKTVTGSRLLGQARYQAATEAGDRTAKPEIDYRIVRRIGDRFIELASSEDSPLMPGDTLKVEVELSKDRGTSGIGSLTGSITQGAAPSSGARKVSSLDLEPVKPILFAEDVPDVVARPSAAREEAEVASQTAEPIDDASFYSEEALAGEGGAVIEGDDTAGGAISLPLPDEETVPEPRVELTGRIPVPERKMEYLPEANPRRRGPPA